MKKLIVLVILSLVVRTVFADCSWSGIDFFPQQKEISTNSMFIIQGYASNESTIEGFRDRIVYLESEAGDIVKLNLQEILKGQMRLTQAIFQLEKSLKPNTTYFLKFFSPTPDEKRELKIWNSEKKEMEEVYWKTTNASALKPLNMDLAINYQDTKLMHFGCGPAANAIFDVKNSGELEVWFKTEVVSLKTNEKTTFYLKAWKGKLSVGYGMCSGAFTFNGGDKYKVRFTAMNTDGKALETTDWTFFNNPY